MNYYIALIIHLVKRDLNIRFKGSYLGILWSLFYPMLHASVYIFVFTYVIPLNIDGYAAFVFCALIGWIWFSDSIYLSSNLYIFNKDIILKPGFKPYILNIEMIFTNLVLFILSLPILIIILLFYKINFSIAILNLPIILLIQFVFTMGISLVVSTLNAIYRDVHQVVNISITLLFYLSSVFYSKDMVGDNLKIFFDINPLAVLVESYRDIFFYGNNPDYQLLVYVLILGLILLYLGAKIFSWNINNVIDRV